MDIMKINFKLCLIILLILIASFSIGYVLGKHNSKKIVMLKIPTKNLEQSKLRIRTQDEIENGR